MRVRLVGARPAVRLLLFWPLLISLLRGPGKGFGGSFILAMREDDWIGRHERVKDLLGSGNPHMRAIGRFLTSHLGPDACLYVRVEVSFVKSSEVLVFQDI